MKLAAELHTVAAAVRMNIGSSESIGLLKKKRMMMMKKDMQVEQPHNIDTDRGVGRG